MKKAVLASAAIILASYSAADAAACSGRFTVEPPGEGLLLEILYYDGAGAKALMATLRGKRQAVTDWQCLKIIIAFPLMTFGVMAAIHWEALKLFLKGARYRSPLRRAGAKARAIPVMAKPQDGAS